MHTKQLFWLQRKWFPLLKCVTNTPYVQSSLPLSIITCWKCWMHDMQFSSWAKYKFSVVVIYLVLLSLPTSESNWFSFRYLYIWNLEFVLENCYSYSLYVLVHLLFVLSFMSFLSVFLSYTMVLVFAIAGCGELVKSCCALPLNHEECSNFYSKRNQDLLFIRLDIQEWHKFCSGGEG